MKNLRFLLVAVVISTGFAFYSKAKAAEVALFPLCTSSPDDQCFGGPPPHVIYDERICQSSDCDL